MQQTYTLTWNGREPKLEKNLIEYLDWYSFVWCFEILWAISDFYLEKYWEKVFMSDLKYFTALAEKYMQLRNLSFKE